MFQVIDTSATRAVIRNTKRHPPSIRSLFEWIRGDYLAIDHFVSTVG